MKNKSVGSFISILVFICSLQTSAQEETADKVIDLGSRLELFIDHYLIRSVENLTLKLHTPVDNGPAVKFDNPWEGVFSGYSTILKDGNLYRLYYRGIPTAGSDGSDNEVTCYAESSDGIEWNKPALNLFEYSGTKNNNIVLAHARPVTHNFSPFIDTNPYRADKYKFKALGGLEEGLIPYGSADGVHWVKMAHDPVITGGEFDSQNVSFWSESEHQYICYLRKWKKEGGKNIRSVARSVSPDFHTWTQPVLMDFGETPAEEIYTNQTSPYFRAPHIYVAIAARFFPGKQVISDDQAKRLNVNPSYYHDCSDAVLMTSRGGNKYQRTFMEGFLRPGIGLGNWVSRTNYPALNVVQTGENEMSFYVNQDYAQPTSHLRRYSLRIDGFCSLHAGYESGEMFTQQFRFTGNNLLINFSTSAAGYILFELLDNNGKPIPGYSFNSCLPLTGNEISRQVEWQNNPQLSHLQGESISIHIRMKDADLYSIKFE
ncbi:MAG: hypothetical protein RBR81_05235 [Bacteroidales bacterium]|jgi:hypothetical protein|nr:hypothetical protein [Bacteroidales bacterium]